MSQLAWIYTREERQLVSGSVLSAVILMGLFDRIVQANAIDKAIMASCNLCSCL